MDKKLIIGLLLIASCVGKNIPVVEDEIENMGERMYADDDDSGKVKMNDLFEDIFQLKRAFLTFCGKYP